jgi:hypothetical protein
MNDIPTTDCQQEPKERQPWDTPVLQAIPIGAATEGKSPFNFEVTTFSGQHLGPS